MILLTPRDADIGGLTVRRILPNHPVRMVGPFVFLDHMGPASIGADQDVDVLPHPHIGLATVTWLFDGDLLHRDSLGTEQPIHPGDVNWMTAGRGIVHSERRLPSRIGKSYRLEGLQAWVGLPRDQAECDPAFAHHPAGSLPTRRIGGAEITIIAGAYFGEESPVEVASPLGYAAIRLPAGASISVPPEHPERAIYCVSGAVAVEDTRLEATRMAVLDPGVYVKVSAHIDSLLMLPAGSPLDGPRFLNWNFVSHDRERLARARDDWAARRFPTIPGDDRDRVELPPARTAPAS